MKSASKPEKPSKPANLLKKDTIVPDEGKDVWIDLEIELSKQPGKGLGIAVTGGPKQLITEAITVKRLVPDSIAALDGRLRKDDRITHIAGRTLIGMTQGEALTLLKEIPQDIHLKCRRRQATRESPSQLGDSQSKAVDVKPRSRSSSRSSERKRSNSGEVDELNVSFEKRTAKEVPFTVAGGEGTVYGESPIVVASVETVESCDLRIGDTIMSIGKCSFDGMAREEALQFLQALKVGHVDVVVARKR